MPEKDFDLEDPLELVGVTLPADEETLDEMARCFMEEFIRMGYSDEAILNLFRRPFYAGAHRLYRLKGEAHLRSLLQQERAK